MLVSCGSWSMADALDMTWRSKVASVPSCNLNRCMSSALYHEAVFSSGVQRGIVWTSTDGENDTPLLRRLLVGFVRRSIGWDVTLSVVDDSETIEDDDAWPQSLLLHKLQSSLLFFKGRDIWDDAMSTIFDGTNELETSTSWQDWGAIFVDNNELSAVMVIEHIVIVHQGLRLWFTRKFRRWRYYNSECVRYVLLFMLLAKKVTRQGLDSPLLTLFQHKFNWCHSILFPSPHSGLLSNFGVTRMQK